MASRSMTSNALAVLHSLPSTRPQDNRGRVINTWRLHIQRHAPPATPSPNTLGTEQLLRTPFPPPLPELAKLVNVQLIRILTYRLIAHPFLPSEIDELTEAIWRELATHGRMSPKVSTKDIFQPRSKLGLGMRHLAVAVHKSFVEAGLRYLNQDGPPAICAAVRDPLLSSQQNTLQCTCGSLVAKWKCEVGAHLGLSCALRCLCACLLCVLHAR